MLEALARGLYQTGQTEPARRAARLAQQAPERTSSNDPFMARVLAEAASFNSFVARANRAAASRDYLRAIGFLDGALRIRPDNVDAMLTKAQLLARLDRHPEAQALARRVLDARPNDVAALTTLGASLAEVGRADEAEEILRGAVNVAPRSAAARIGLATVLRRSDPEDSRRLVREVLEDDPLHRDAQMLLANLLIVAGHMQPAAQYLREVGAAGGDERAARAALERLPR